MTPGPAHLAATGGKEPWGEASLPCPHHPIADEGCGEPPCTPATGVSSTVLYQARGGAGSAQCHRWQCRSGTSAWPLIVTWAWDINTDFSCHRPTDPDMTPGDSLGLDVPLASGSRQRGPQNQEHLHGVRWQPRAGTSAWLLIVSGATECSCSRASPWPPHICPPYTPAECPGPPFFMVCKPLRLPFSSPALCFLQCSFLSLHHAFIHRNGACDRALGVFPPRLMCLGPVLCFYKSRDQGFQGREIREPCIRERRPEGARTQYSVS